MERDFSKVYYKKKYNESANFPKAENGQSWRGFRLFSFASALLIFGVEQALIYFKLISTDIILTIRIVIAILLTIGIVGYFNNIRVRWKFFEREVARNDKMAIKLKKRILKRMSIDKQTEATQNKDKKDERDKAILEAVSRIRNIVVLVNTRQALNHKVYRTYTILFHKPIELMAQQELERLIKGQGSREGDSVIASIAKQSIYDLTERTVAFSRIKNLKNGDYYIEAKEDLGTDPWYYDRELSRLRDFKEESEMEHSVPYQPCIFRGYEFKGYTNHTQENEIKKEKAQKWLDENIDDIISVLAENEIEAQYVPDSVAFRQSTAEVEFTMPTNLKVSNSKEKNLMGIAEVIDEMLDTKGSSLKSRLDTLHLSLALPNGKTRDGNDRRNDKGEIEDFTQILNLEDVLRGLYG